MTQLVPFFLYGWIIAGPVLFWFLAPRLAAMVVAVGGFLFLPVANFDPIRDQGVALPYWIMPTALPSQFWLTKATAVGLSLLLGMFVPIVAPRRKPGAYGVARTAAPRDLFHQPRFKLPDVFMLVWCLWPAVSGLSRDLPLADSAAMTTYQTLAWGVPYLAGRIYFTEADALGELADALMYGALLNIPICLIEFIAGPKVYGWLYGFHPYAQDGVVRYFRSRPLGFFELGNQSGIYLSSVALLAVWLATHGRKRRVARIPMRLCAIILVLLAILAQGVGAILLAVGGLALLFLLQRLRALWPLAAVGGILLLAAVALGGIVLTHHESAIEHSRIGQIAGEILDLGGRHSLAWRLHRDALHLPAGMQHPITGSARWDWWDTPGDANRDSRARPWDLPLLVLGMYGSGGLLLWLGIMWLPVLSALRMMHPRFWPLPMAAAPVALCGVVGVMFFDSLLNSPVFLPLLLASGGLAHMRTAGAREVRP